MSYTGATARIDHHQRRARAKLPAWASALALVISTMAVMLTFMLAGFGLYAALRIAHGFGAAVEHTASSGVADTWTRSRPIEAGVVPQPILPPVLARSDPGDTDSGSETQRASEVSAPSSGVAPAPAPPSEAYVPSVSVEPAPQPAPSVVSADGVKSIAKPKPAPASSTKGAKPSGVSQGKPHPPARRRVVQKLSPRTAPQTTTFGFTANQFQTTANTWQAQATSHARQVQTTAAPRQRAAPAASPFQPMFNPP